MKFKYLILLVFLSTLLVQCAAPATIEGMTVKDYKSQTQIGDRIFIKPVIGGKKTNPLGTSQISGENFEGAFKKSIIESNFFSKISTIIDDDWVLEINLIAVDQPSFGFNLTVKTAVEYKLYYKNELVLKKNINQSGRATMSDTFFGVKRLRLANEVSARNNIKALFKFLNEISTASASAMSLS